MSHVVDRVNVVIKASIATAPFLQPVSETSCAEWTVGVCIYRRTRSDSSLSAAICEP